MYQAEGLHVLSTFKGYLIDLSKLQSRIFEKYFSPLNYEKENLLPESKEIIKSLSDALSSALGILGKVIDEADDKLFNWEVNKEEKLKM